MNCKRCEKEFDPPTNPGTVKLYCTERCRHAAEMSRYREKHPYVHRKKTIPWVIEKKKVPKKPRSLKNIIQVPFENLTKAIGKWVTSDEEKRTKRDARLAEKRRGISYVGKRAQLRNSDPLYAIKESARSKLRSAVAKKEIIKPLACQRCGKVARLSGHHYRGYDYPLVVIWLCQFCHSQAHKLNP